MYRQQCTYPARRIVLILFLEQIPLHSSHLMELKKIALPVCSYSTCTMTEKIALFHPCRRVTATGSHIIQTNNIYHIRYVRFFSPLVRAIWRQTLSYKCDVLSCQPVPDDLHRVNIVQIGLYSFEHIASVLDQNCLIWNFNVKFVINAGLISQFKLRSILANRYI